MFFVCYLCGSYYRRRHHFLIIDSVLPIAKKVRAQTLLYVFYFLFFNNMIALRFLLEVFVLLFFRFLSFFLIFTKSRSLKREPLALVQRQHCTQSKLCVLYDSVTTTGLVIFIFSLLLLLYLRNSSLFDSCKESKHTAHHIGRQYFILKMC